MHVCVGHLHNCRSDVCVCVLDCILRGLYALNLPSFCCSCCQCCCWWYGNGTDWNIILTEYTPDAYRRRGYLTDFHGSAGTAVVPSTALAALIEQNKQQEKEDKSPTPMDTTDDNNSDKDTESTTTSTAKAYLWTDSRYWNEAGLNLDASVWVLQKQGLPTTLTIPQWLAQQAALYYQAHGKALRIGIDPYVHAASFPTELQRALKDAQQGLEAPPNHDDDDDSDNAFIGKLVTLSSDDPDKPPLNLVDAIWKDRPALPKAPFRVHALEHAGVSWQEKVARVRQAMALGGSTTKDSNSKTSHPCTLAVFGTLDDVAYLLNVRATGDIDT